MRRHSHTTVEPANHYGCLRNRSLARITGPQQERSHALPSVSRRRALSMVVVGIGKTSAGCLWESSFPDADIVAGPEGDLVFEPAELSVPVGTTISWGFASGGHNVSCRPEDSDMVALPDEAEPFASYGSDESPHESLVPRSETYEHRFTVSGEYVYVCIPHDRQGMVGTIRVE